MLSSLSFLLEFIAGLLLHQEKKQKNPCGRETEFYHVSVHDCPFASTDVFAERVTAAEFLRRTLVTVFIVVTTIIFPSMGQSWFLHTSSSSASKHSNVDHDLLSNVPNHVESGAVSGDEEVFLLHVFHDDGDC